MKAPYKVKILYQLTAFSEVGTDEENYRITFNSYKKAVERFNEEVIRANGAYLVDLQLVIEKQKTKGAIMTKMRGFTLGDNL